MKDKAKECGVSKSIFHDKGIGVIVNMVVLLILMMLWQSAVQQLLGFRYIDEIITLVLGIVFFWNVLKRKYRPLIYEKCMLLCLVIFYFCGLVSTIVYNYQKDVFYGLLSGIFSIKSFIAYFGMRALMFRVEMDRRSLKRILYILRGGMFTTGILLLLDQFIELFPHSIYRFGIKTTSFIFTHPTELGCFALVSFILILYLRNYLGYIKCDYLIWVATVFIVLKGGRYKSVGFLALFGTMQIMMFFVKKFKFKYTLLGLPMVWLVARKQIIYYFTDITTARGMLYYNGFRIAKDHFPLGSGFGTFGTEFSRKRYSILYKWYEMSDKYGFKETAPYYVADTMWPPIVAETGVIGLFCMLLLFVEMILMVAKQAFTRRESLFLYGMILYGLFESIGDSIFMSSRGVAIFIAFAFMFTCSEKKNSKGVKKI